MNTNLQNQATSVTGDFIKSIPTAEFYSNILTRPKIANIYDKYYSTNTTHLQVMPEQAIRAIMVQCFRYVNMKIQDVSVLLVYGLNNLRRADLDLTLEHLADKLAKQNPDPNDIDVINRIIAQVVTKLPADLREKLVPQLRIQMIQTLHQTLKIMFDPSEAKFKMSPASAREPQTAIQYALATENNPSGASLEGFQDRLLLAPEPSKLTSLEHNFLMEMNDLETALGTSTLQELKQNGYAPELLTKTSINMRIGAGDYNTQLKAMSKPAGSRPGILTDTPTQNIISSKYYQEDPQLHMDAKTKELYYFDEYSGTLVPVTDVTRITGEEITTAKQLNTLLKDHNLSKAETDKLLDELNPSGTGHINIPQKLPTGTSSITKPTGTVQATKPVSLATNKVTHWLKYSGIGAGIIVLVIILVILVRFMLKRKGTNK
jgi:hypothetical protein